MKKSANILKISILALEIIILGLKKCHFRGIDRKFNELSETFYFFEKSLDLIEL